jgi:hypothetical protein
MAVVILKYLRARQQVKAHLRYITHRAGESKARHQAVPGKGKTTRELFNADGITERRAFYTLIDSAQRGTIFYKFMISTHPVKEDTHKDLDLQQVTRYTIRNIEKRIGRNLHFVATIHNNHSNVRHVHGIFLLQGRLSKQEFISLGKLCRLAATTDASLQIKAIDSVGQNPKLRLLKRSRPLNHKTQNRIHHQNGKARHQIAPYRTRLLRVPRFKKTCRSCGYGQLSGVSSFLSNCPRCGKRLNRRFTGLSL